MSNQLRVDPTRTALLRKQFMRDMNKRFSWLIKEIKKLLIDLDVLGLQPPIPLKIMIERQAWRFLTDSQKVTQFEQWFQQQVNAGVLQTNKVPPWTAKYVDSAYRKGMVKAYSDVHKLDTVTASAFGRGSQAEFLRSAFAQPEVVSKIQLIYTRAYSQLKGVTDQMGQQMSRILADGLVHGSGPAEIARNMSNAIGKLSRTRANVIARTEIISAHAEGQLDSFQQLGVEEIQVMAEWSTAEDACDLCSPLDGAVMSVEEARGEIPRHPNCRCMWIPADVGEDKKGQLWGKDKDAAIADSVVAEGGAEKSSWVGKTLLKDKSAKVRAAKASEQAVQKVIKEAVAGPAIGTNWTASLTKQERVAKTWWTDSFENTEVVRKVQTQGYSTTLRQYKEDLMSKSFMDALEESKTHLPNLVSGLAKAPKFEGTVHRGLALFKNQLDDIIESKVINFSSYASTSKTETIAREFMATHLDEFSNIPVIMDIKLKNGIDLLGKYDEVLIPMNSKFQLVSRTVVKQPITIEAYGKAPVKLKSYTKLILEEL